LVPFTDINRSSTYQLASFENNATEDEDRQPPRPCATPPPHAYRAGIISTGIAPMGDADINTRTRGIIVIVDDLAIDTRSRANAIDINESIDDLAINARMQANVVDTNEHRIRRPNSLASSIPGPT
jgi:hypothetical protein